jgi:hypothetical protein
MLKLIIFSLLLGLNFSLKAEQVDANRFCQQYRNDLLKMYAKTLNHYSENVAKNAIIRLYKENELNNVYEFKFVGQDKSKSIYEVVAGEDSINILVTSNSTSSKELIVEGQYSKTVDAIGRIKFQGYTCQMINPQEDAASLIVENNNTGLVIARLKVKNFLTFINVSE